jgi:3-hydroxybutyryl-CoA dehydrogenase
VSKQVIGIVGGGLMGHGLAYLFAAAGHEVGVYEPDTDSRASLPQRWRQILDLFEDDLRVLDRIAVHGRLAPAIADAAFVFEAAPERLALKQRIFAELEGVVSVDTVLASNSSAIPSTQIARDLAYRERVIGTHFWNPPHLVPLVEVIQNQWTTNSVVERTMALLRRAGKTPVHVRRDVPGFVGNRLQHALKREAIALLADGVCDAETIDTVVKQGLGARMAVLGPMEQSDLVGLDLTLDIANVLYPDLDRTAGPHPFLQAKVANGHLGMKTGEGFRKWSALEADSVRAELSRFLTRKATQELSRVKEATAGSSESPSGSDGC